MIHLRLKVILAIHVILPGVHYDEFSKTSYQNETEHNICLDPSYPLLVNNFRKHIILPGIYYDKFSKTSYQYKHKNEYDITLIIYISTNHMIGYHGQFMKTQNKKRTFHANMCTLA